jgi:hypothetical protein
MDRPVRQETSLKFIKKLARFSTQYAVSARNAMELHAPENFRA